MSREVLLLVVGSNRNTWMPSFGFASHHIATAVADGRISDRDLTEFVTYDEVSCRFLAHQAGLQFQGDAVDGPGINTSGWTGIPYQADTEDVSVAVDAIKALRDESFLGESASWQFHTERDHRGEWLEGVDVTLDDLDRMRAQHVTTYADAARVMLEGDDTYRKENA